MMATYHEIAGTYGTAGTCGRAGTCGTAGTCGAYGTCGTAGTDCVVLEIYRTKKSTLCIRIIFW